MADMIALHNTEAEGYHPADVNSAEIDGEEVDCFGVWTRKNFRPDTVRGNRVWVIRAEGSPRNYTLCYTFIVDHIDKSVSPFFVYGKEGEPFDPEIPLDQRSGWFGELYDQQNNFSLGLSKINDRFAAEFERLRASCQSKDAG